MNFKNTFFLIFFLFISGLSAKELSVVCTTSDLAWLAKKIGKSKVSVISLSGANDDPHYLDVTPKNIKLLSKADILCLVGLDLEIGWLPKTIQKSGNKAIKPGQPGYCDCSTYIEVVEKPKSLVNRSMGHLHQKGNPHYQLDPNQFILAAKSIFESLIKIHPKEKSFFLTNLETLKNEFKDFNQKHVQNMKKTKRIKVTQYHKELSYLISYLNMESFEAIEKVPGVSPSAKRLYNFSNSCKEKGVHICLASKSASKNKLSKFSAISNISCVQENISVQDFSDKNSYYDLMDSWINKTLNFKTKK